MVSKFPNRIISSGQITSVFVETPLDSPRLDQVCDCEQRTQNNTYTTYGHVSDAEKRVLSPDDSPSGYHN